jgi:hypothetical protein
MSTQPYEALTWRIVPGHTALVVIDPQNDFLHLPRGRRPRHLDATWLP